MNRREKILAGAVGLMVLVLVLNYGIGRLVTAFRDRADTCARLESDIQSKEVMIHRGKLAQRLLQAYKDRSLPSNPNMANSRYRAWLHQWVEKAGMKTDAVKFVRTNPKLSHDRLVFNVMGDATLPELVDLLYRFYSADYLHRIKGLSAKPGVGKYLTVSFTIEAISMSDAKADLVLKEMPAKRLVYDDLAAYQKGIVSRNPYAPPNQPPKIVSSDSQSGYVDQTVSFSVKAEDPEKLPVRYRLDGENPEGAKIDTDSGRVSWKSASKGEFEFHVVAFDDGVPSMEAMQTIRVRVTDPPPPTVEENRRPSFDEAKYTYVTGIVEVNGRRQVWLTVRSEGKWLRLFEGETFQVGAYEGKVVKINVRDVEIQSPDATRLVRYGQSINEGEEVKKDPGVAANSN